MQLDLTSCSESPHDLPCVECVECLICYEKETNMRRAYVHVNVRHIRLDLEAGIVRSSM